MSEKKKYKMVQLTQAVYDELADLKQDLQAEHRRDFTFAETVQEAVREAKASRLRQASK